MWKYGQVTLLIFDSIFPNAIPLLWLHHIHLISKSYVGTNFGQISTGRFRGLDVCFWVKLNLQTFKYIIFSNIFHKFFGANSALARLQASQIGRYLLQNRKFVVFYRSNIKNEIWALQNISRIHVKYLARARTLTLPNEAQKFRGCAHF